MSVWTRVIGTSPFQKVGANGHLLRSNLVRKWAVRGLAGSAQKSCANGHFFGVMNVSALVTLVAAAKPIEEHTIRFLLQLLAIADVAYPVNASVHGTAEICPCLCRWCLREHSWFPFNIGLSAYVDSSLAICLLRTAQWLRDAPKHFPSCIHRVDRSSHD